MISFLLSKKMGVPSSREGFIRHTDAHTRVHSQTENFFFGQLLYTSAVAMVMRVYDPAKARDWLEWSEVGEGRGTLLQGY